jgi:arylsulfatase A-like enzyme
MITRPLPALQAAALAGGAAVLVACGGPPPPARPNVILVSLDTLRADHSPTYGYRRPTTPRIDEVARRATVFDRCYTEASHTLPAHATLLTGLYPETHGVIASTDSLSESTATLAEQLREAGYRTAAFVNCGFLHPRYGLDRGFEVYDYLHDRHRYYVRDRLRTGRSATETNRSIMQWLEGAPDEPFFLFLHYYDVHSDWGDRPYDAPPRFLERFASEQPPGFLPGKGDESASLYLARVNDTDARWGERELAHLRSLYDAGVAYTDEEVGRLLALLQMKGLLARSLVILVSDHGEEFQEHGKLLHTQVYEELVRVPLVVAFPAADRRQAGPRRVAALAQLGDLMPTILDYLGLDPPAGLQGMSLLPPLRGEGPGRPLAYFRNQDGSQYGVGDGRFKLVWHQDPVVVELFDLAEDPNETVDLAGTRGDEALRLLGELERWRSAAAAARPPLPAPLPLDADTRRRLEALGYVGDDPD